VTRAPSGPLDERERDEATALLAYAFPELADLPERMAVWPLERMFAVRDDRRLAAVVLWRVERVHAPAADLPIAMCGPGGTRPDLRGRGLLAQAQPHFLQLLREAGCVLAGLETPITRWHRRNGWGLSSAVVRYRYPPAALRPVISPASGAVQLAASVAALPGLYRAEGRRRFGLLVRDAARWRSLLAAKGRAWAVWQGQDGTAGGYVLYRQQVGQGEDSPLRLVVDELFVRDADAYLGLLCYLAEHPNIAEVRWDAPQDDPLLSVAREPRALEPKLCVDKMLRVLNIEPAAALVPDVAASVQLVVRLDDPQIPQHAGDWVMRPVDGVLKLERVRDRPSLPMLHLTAPVLAALLTGYLTGDAALMSGLAIASGTTAAAAACALFPLRRPPYAVEPW